jgi:hypothetical protein
MRFELIPTAGQIKATPFTMAAQETMVPIMTGSGSRNGIMGTADRMPTVYREGAMDALSLPSRMGEKLHYRDGRIEAVKRSVAYHNPFYYSDEQAITNEIQAGY